jgi:hypothetical protein
MTTNFVRIWARAAVVAAALNAPAAHAVIYLTGSVSASQSNAGFQTHNSRGGSGTVAFDLGRYVRLGFTHRQDLQSSSGYVADSEGGCDISDDTSLGERCLDYESKTHIISNSVDFTLILYEGDVFVPFVMAGGIVKTYRFEIRKEGTDTLKEGPITDKFPRPNLGIGMGIRLNREFSLKLSYTTSPGARYTPDGEVHSAYDKVTSLGLTYQL